MPPDKPRKPKPPVPKYLSFNEIDALFKVIKSVRDRAMFRVVYHRGLRASEVGRLTRADFNLTEGRSPIASLYVTRLKGSISSTYTLTTEETTALRAWLRIRGMQAGPLFPSRNHRPIGRRRLDELMKEYCALAGIPSDKAHMHALKHSCGTHVAELLNGDGQAVQDHLGHADIRSTQGYLHFARREGVAARLVDWGKGKRRA